MAGREKDQGDADSNLEPFVKLLFPRPLLLRERRREMVMEMEDYSLSIFLGSFFSSLLMGLLLSRIHFVIFIYRYLLYLLEFTSQSFFGLILL